MGLRLAQRQKNSQTLPKRNYSSNLTSASFYLPGGNSETVVFGPGLTVLCGRNGAGKSSALGALWRAMNSSLDVPEYVPRPPEWMSSVQVLGTTDGQAWSAVLNLTDGTLHSEQTSEIPTVDYLDPSAQTEDVLVHLRRDDNLDDLLEGVDPFDFPPDLLDLMSHVVGRQYDMVRVWEVTAFSEEDAPMPYIKVSASGYEYDLLRMGRGELNAAYMLWRLSELAPGSVVLLEEPESHLAFSSQSSLIDCLIAIVVTRDITIVASSHAPDFFRRLPDDHTCLISSLPIPKIRSHLPTSEIASHLGLSASTGPLLVVEDIVASHVLRAILKELSSTSIKSAPIRYAAAGESGVERVIRELDTGSQRDGHIIGVLDGDRRPKSGSSREQVFGYLPGSAGPESTLRSVVNVWRMGNLEWQPGGVATAEAFEMALEKVDGVEDHDWIVDLARELGVHLSVLVHALVRLMLADRQHLQWAEELVSWLDR